MIGAMELIENNLRGDEALREFVKPLMALLYRPETTELIINEPGVVFAESDCGWERHEFPQLDMDHLMQMAKAIATHSKQEISAQHPILSAMLPTQERVQIVMPPAVPVGTISFSVRRPSARIQTLAEYESQKVFESTQWHLPEAEVEGVGKMTVPGSDQKLIKLLRARCFADFLAEAVTNRLNICVVGDTGSGKTTLMKTLCQSIPGYERIITIEDVRELFMPNHDNQVNLLYSKGGQGQAKVTPADLIASCMRMKPDRVLLAELRGSESYDFLKLLTTGHSGSITSFHAESCSRAIARFALMAKEHPEAAAYDDVALKRLLFMTMDVIAHLKAEPIFDGDGQQIGKRRVMTEIYFDPYKRLELAYAT
ncbi:MAG: P-type transfer ATPase VirB11 [Pseudomonadota bacterium]|jgi:type IV secretion system protein VirB11